MNIKELRKELRKELKKYPNDCDVEVVLFMQTGGCNQFDITSIVENGCLVQVNLEKLPAHVSWRKQEEKRLNRSAKF